MAFPTERNSKGQFVKGHGGFNPDLKGCFKKGHKWAEEINEKIRLSRIGNKSTLGRRCQEANNWRGGKTTLSHLQRGRMDWKLWRTKVYKRDGYTCQNCGDQGVHLHPHHILNRCSFPEKMYEVDNGITLCKECHYEFHKEYGFTNNNEEQLKEFLKKGGD